MCFLIVVRLHHSSGVGVGQLHQHSWAEEERRGEEGRGEERGERGERNRQKCRKTSALTKQTIGAKGSRCTVDLAKL